MIGKTIRQQIARALAVVTIFTGTFTFQCLTNTTEVEAAIAQTRTSVNFRVGPSSNYTVIRKLSAGSVIDVISHTTSWSKVTQGGTTGYLSTSYIDFTATGKITGRVNLRKTASSSGTILTKIPAGSTVKVLAGPVNSWYKVIWNNLSGYVYKTYINVSDATVASPVENTSGVEPAGPVTTTGKYTLTGSTPKYMNAADAKAQKNSVGAYPAGSYYIFKTSDGMYNISLTKGEAGAWINPDAKTAPVTPSAPTPSAPSATPVPEYTATYEGYTKMTWTFTFYTNLPVENGGYTVTAMGTKLRYGVLASNYWPLRSQVILPDWGNFIIEDRGGSNFYSKYRLDMLIPRNSGESDYQYLSRVNNMGVRSISGYIKPFK